MPFGSRNQAGPGALSTLIKLYHKQNVISIILDYTISTVFDAPNPNLSP